MKLFASIYIGSYEVTMKIFEIGQENSLKEIDCLKMQLDISMDMLHKGEVLQSTMDRLCKVLLDMKKVMNNYKVDGFDCVASSNLRQAKNELYVLEQIKLRTGLNVKVLSNSEQRFLGYEAVASMEEFDRYISESAVLVDVGGLSLQMTLFSKGKIVTTQQLPLGTVSVADDLQRLGSVDNATDQIYEVVYKEIDVFKTMFLKDIKPQYLILLGDQVNTNAELFSDVAAKELKQEDYTEFLRKINRQFIKQLAKKYDVFLDNENLVEPFVMVHRAIVDKVEPEFVYAPGIAVSEGIAYDYCFKKKWLEQSHDFSADVISAAWSIAKRYGSYQPHLKALVKFSGLIFDATKKYHGMGKRERILMEAIAILHDCGKYISIADASDCSYTIIMSSEILGLTHKEREIIATTVAANRRQLMGYEYYQDRFTPHEYLMISKLLAMLKVANALDRSHKQKLKSVDMKVKKSELVITIESNASIGLEKGFFSKNADFFESVFSIRPIIREKKSY